MDKKLLKKIEEETLVLKKLIEYIVKKSWMFYTTTLNYVKTFTNVGNDVEVYQVSELCYCRLKTLRIRELIKNIQSFEDFLNWYLDNYGGNLPNIILGHLVEQGLKIVTGFESGKLVTKLFNIKINSNEEEIVKKILIFGEPDIVAYVNGKPVAIIEVKYSSFLNEIPEHYILQLKLYMNLYDVEEGRLILVTPNRVRERKIVGKVSDDEVIEHVTHWYETFPLHEWECKRCYFRKDCKYAVIEEEKSNETEYVI